ncbi:hypothetical protein Tco_0826476 [Tanacetum coccineum]
MKDRGIMGLAAAELQRCWPRQSSVWQCTGRWEFRGLEVGWIRRIHVLDTAYWGFLGVGTTFDIFQNIILIPYLEYGVLSPLDTTY